MRRRGSCGGRAVVPRGESPGHRSGINSTRFAAGATLWDRDAAGEAIREAFHDAAASRARVRVEIESSQWTFTPLESEEAAPSPPSSPPGPSDSWTAASELCNPRNRGYHKCNGVRVV